MIRSIVVLLLIAGSIFQVCDVRAEKINWTKNPFSNNVFIENKGQYNGAPDFGSNVLFGIENAGEQILFSKKGIMFLYHVKNIDAKKKENADKKTYPESAEKENRFRVHVVKMEWAGAEKEVTVIAENPVGEEYGFYSPESENGVLKCTAYKKIIFKNIYKGVDVEYTFHPKGGLKYNFILHPGADASKIKMLYSGIQNIKINNEGNVVIQSDAGKITDHAPVSFYSGGLSKVTSSFSLQGNNVSILIGSYDNTKELIIDPWVISPGFANVNRGYDLSRNPATGDIFVFGGYPGYQLKKFDLNGNLIYTFLTNPSAIYNPGGNYYGDMEIDLAGNVFLTSGCCTGNVIKINGTTQALMWTSSIGGEPWRLFFDAANNRLIVGGALFTVGGANLAALNSATGALMNSIVVSQPSYLAEIRSLFIAPNNSILCLHVSEYLNNLAATNRLTSVSSAFALNYDVQNGFVLGEDGSFYAYNDNPGLCGVACVHGFNGIVANASYVYIYDGATLIKRNLASGTQIGTAAIPGGTSDNNSGITMDTCGFIYVGTQNEIRKYDSTLTFISAAAVTGAVYDLTTGLPGEILACGNGFLSSINFPCSVFSATDTSTNPLCNGSCTGTATAFPVGGASPYTYLWNTSPAQMTQTATSLCAGTYTATITDANGITTTVSVTITEPSALTASVSSTIDTCGYGNGTATVIAGGGTGALTYNWSPSGGTNPVATGLAGGNYSVVVTDSNGCTISASIVVATSTLPVINILSQNNPLCFGDATGSVSINVGSGTSPYSYLWSTIPPQNSSGATGLTAGNYSVIVIDVLGCTSTISVTLTEPNALSLLLDSASSCDSLGGSASATVSGGTVGYSFQWTPGGDTTSAISGLGSGIYTCQVTDANGCTITSSVNVITFTPPIATATTSEDSLIIGESTTIVASGGGSYFWIPSAGLACNTCASTTASPETTINYCVFVTDSNGCVDSACVRIYVEIICGEIFIPNAFSPNDDYNNELECVYGGCIKQMTFSIYSRWGEKVFETTDQSHCWDGTFLGEKMNSGVFAYYFEAFLLTGEKVTRKGNISLIR